MNFITNPIMKSFVGFDNLFNEFERLSTYKEQSYAAYNIDKTSAKNTARLLIVIYFVILYLTRYMSTNIDKDSIKAS